MPVYPWPTQLWPKKKNNARNWQHGCAPDGAAPVLRENTSLLRLDLSGAAVFGHLLGACRRRTPRGWIEVEGRRRKKGSRGAGRAARWASTSTTGSSGVRRRRAPRSLQKKSAVPSPNPAEGTPAGTGGGAGRGRQARVGPLSLSRPSAPRAPRGVERAAGQKKRESPRHACSPRQWPI